MRWKDGKGSSNIDDRRGQSTGRRGGAPLMLILNLVGRKFGITGIIVVLVGAYFFTGGNIGQLIGGGAPTASNGPVQESSDQAYWHKLSSVVLAKTEDSWAAIFARHDAQYRPPQMVLYRGSTQTACGMGQAQTGPFYCPGDQKVYLDLAFFDLMKQRYGGGGDFAAAYVIAHEVGHHVQNLLGIEKKMRAAQAADPSQKNALSVRLELQADCFAGLWAAETNRREQFLEAGDMQQGMKTAQAIGDDHLQQQAGQAVRPDAFTHGASAQRQKWLKTGMQATDLAACDTFN